MGGLKEEMESYGADIFFPHVQGHMALLIWALRRQVISSQFLFIHIFSVDYQSNPQMEARIRMYQFPIKEHEHTEFCPPDTLIKHANQMPGTWSL